MFTAQVGNPGKSIRREKPKGGFRTPAKTLPFSLIEHIKGGEYEMVQLDIETSNSLFKVFEDWNRILVAA